MNKTTDLGERDTPYYPQVVTQRSKERVLTTSYERVKHRIDIDKRIYTGPLQ